MPSLVKAKKKKKLIKQTIYVKEKIINKFLKGIQLSALTEIHEFNKVRNIVGQHH